MGCEDNTCNNLQDAVCSEFGFRAAVIRILCRIQDLLSLTEGVPVPVVTLPQVNILAVEIESDYGSYADTGLLDNGKKLEYFNIINTSDCDLEFSFDGGSNTYITVMSGTTYHEYIPISFLAKTKIRMRKVSGQTASIGQVILSGRY